MVTISTNQISRLGKHLIWTLEGSKPLMIRFEEADGQPISSGGARILSLRGLSPVTTNSKGAQVNFLMTQRGLNGIFNRNFGKSEGAQR